MKGIIKVFLISLVFPLLAVQGSASVQRLGFHVDAGVALPQEENIHSGLTTGFGFTYPLSRKISVSIDFNHWSCRVREEEGQLYKGRLSLTPFSFTFQLGLLEEKKNVIPYISLGSGLVFTQFKMEEYVFIPEITLTQEIERGVAFQIGGGSDFILTETLAFYVEALYFYRKAGGKTTITDMNYGMREEEFSVNLHSVLLQVGFKYFI